MGQAHDEDDTAGRGGAEFGAVTMQLTLAVHRARRLFPTKTAVIFADRRRTWEEFADRVARLAGVLQDLGVGPGDRVAMLSHSSDRYLEFFFAAFWAGGIAVPVSTRYAEPETAFLMQDCGAKVLLVGDEFTAMAEALRPQCPDLAHVIFAGEGALPAGMIDYEAVLGARDPVVDAGRRGDDVAVLFYTGGTTGRSKGVMLTHINCMANSFGGMVHTKLDSSVVGLHAGPLYHAAAGSRVFTNTLLGATHVVIPRFTVKGVLEAIQQHRITFTSMVPTMMTMILNEPDLDAYDLSSLKMIGYGGAPMPVATLEALIRKLPHVRFAQAYGMTELSPACTYLEPDDHTLDPARVHRLASGGRSIVGCDIRVVDPQDRDVPVGEIGEIIVAGPTVMKGYWNQPEMTAEALRGGYMHTGDAGYLDADGYVYVSDRIKDMIVTGGENVYSIEVENAVLTHSAIRECAVIGVPHPLWGEAVHAVVTFKAGRSATAEEIIAHCKTRIAGFKCPQTIEVREAMPLSQANKILKTDLRRPHWEGRARAVN
ncbi:MAG: long-chain-fatty-acid--CoA ligase [Phreatobacter sp.]|uniref:long-chain-fatty-acid--CoA ligase n=1 Tax=Phreatobacter sp. TaxID=1966341 RepID=UPI0040361365